MHHNDPSTQEVKAEVSLSLRPAWSKIWVSGKSGTDREILFCKKMIYQIIPISSQEPYTKISQELGINPKEVCSLKN